MPTSCQAEISTLGWQYMIWVNIIAVIILILSFIGGLKDGAVKAFFSSLGFIIAIPLAGFSYRLIAVLLSFLPGENWENFVGFFVTLVIISVIWQLIFLLPRKIFQKIWKKGAFFRLLGGTLNVLGASIGMVIFTLVVAAYPIFGWLQQAAISSSVLMWLVEHLSFVQAMLPEVFQDMATTIVAVSLM